MQGGGNDKLEEVISIDSNYSAHVTDVNHASNPQYLFIYIHGMVPGGRLYSPMFIQSLLHTKYKNNSYCIYKRYIPNNDNDNYNLIEEMERFDKIIMHTFPNEIQKDVNIVLIGHSYGATFAKYFLEHSSLLIYKAISLDGSLLYETIPYFIKLEAGIENINTDEIEFTPTQAIYKGKDYVGTKLISKEYYNALYITRNPIDSRFDVVYYYEGDGQNITMEKKKHQYFRNYYELRYTKEYSHSLHLWYPKCLEKILDTLLHN